MIVKVCPDEIMKHHDVGGGYRVSSLEIYIDPSLSQRMKRKVAIFEVLGAMLEYTLSEDMVSDMAEVILDVLDQVEPCEEVK